MQPWQAAPLRCTRPAPCWGLRNYDYLADGGKIPRRTLRVEQITTRAIHNLPFHRLAPRMHSAVKFHAGCIPSASPCVGSGFHCPLTCSGPLPHRITPGRLTPEMTFSRLMVTCATASEKSTSMPSVARLKSLVRSKSQIHLPSLNWSCMKSADRTWSFDAGAVNAASHSRTIRLFTLDRRTQVFASHHVTKLWG